MSRGRNRSIGKAPTDKSPTASDATWDRIDGVGRIIRVVVLSGCAITIACCVVALQIDAYRGVRLVGDHVTTTARVTDVGAASGRPGGDSATTAWADLTFTTADGRTVSTRIFVGIDRTPAVGDDLTIDYLPSHPQTVREAGRFWSDDVRAALFQFCALDLPALGGVTWLAWWVWRSRRRPAETTA